MNKIFCISVNKRCLVVVFLAMFLTSLVSCFYMPNEFFPTKKTLKSVVNTRIEPVEDKEYKTAFTPEYSGRYAISLVLKQKTRITGIGVNFSLIGAFEIRGEGDMLIYKGSFSEKISNQNTGATLSKFEIDRTQRDDSKSFHIVFNEGTEHLSRYYSEITLHVSKDLKYSIFD